MVKRILVGIDFSEPSRRALERAVSLAEQLGVPLVAVHALAPPFPVPFESEVVFLDPAWTQEVEREAYDKLETWLAPYKPLLSHYAGIKSLVRWGRPLAVLAEEAGPDTLAIVGPVGHSKLERLMFGSTAEGMIRSAPCDVLVVRQDSET